MNIKREGLALTNRMTRMTREKIKSLYRETGTEMWRVKRRYQTIFNELQKNFIHIQQLMDTIRRIEIDGIFIGRQLLHAFSEWINYIEPQRMVILKMLQCDNIFIENINEGHREFITMEIELQYYVEKGNKMETKIALTRAILNEESYLGLLSSRPYSVIRHDAMINKLKDNGLNYEKMQEKLKIKANKDKLREIELLKHYHNNYTKVNPFFVMG